jgi:hypothetical protein
MFYTCHTENVIIIDENSNDLSKNDDCINGAILAKRKELLQLNLDSKYETINWFISDIQSQISGHFIQSKDATKDSERYSNKIKSPLFRKRIIYIDGGLGDHVMCLPLLYKISSDSYICCKYKFVYENLDTLGFIDWNDELFGSYKRYVYEYGYSNNSKSIIDAFFEMYGIERQNEDTLSYNGLRYLEPEFENKDKILLICTSAAKINELDSNKDWYDIRWFKLVYKLKKEGYFVIQVGSSADNQIPNVDSKFLDKPLSNLAGLIEKCCLWISVDTFFHHFASAINPDVGICLTPFYNDHAKHNGVIYVEKDCGKNFSDRKWWLDSQQPERKECMSLISVDDIISKVIDIQKKIS